MVSPATFTGLVVLVALQRLWELGRSAQNEKALREKGGYEVGQGHFWVMRLVHTGWLVGCVAEVWVAPVASLPLFWIGLVAFLAGQWLRYLAIRNLGPRWTVKAMVVPGEQVVGQGPFRYLRHPNYLGVVLELAGLPLMGGCVATALAFSLANFLLLRLRIRVEEKALRKESNYGQVFD